jgi:hypothetical protein
MEVRPTRKFRPIAFLLGVRNAASRGRLKRAILRENTNEVDRLIEHLQWGRVCAVARVPVKILCR